MSLVRLQLLPTHPNERAKERFKTFAQKTLIGRLSTHRVPGFNYHTTIRLIPTTVGTVLMCTIRPNADSLINLPSFPSSSTLSSSPSNSPGRWSLLLALVPSYRYCVNQHARFPSFFYRPLRTHPVHHSTLSFFKISVQFSRLLESFKSFAPPPASPSPTPVSEVLFAVSRSLRLRVFSFRRGLRSVFQLFGKRSRKSQPLAIN